MTQEKNESTKDPQFTKENTNSSSMFHQSSSRSLKKEIQDEPLLGFQFETTDELSIPPRLIDQVIGQEKATAVIRKAAIQKRHVLLIGEPGTGKSLLGNALAELLPTQGLEDIVCMANTDNPNNPKIITVPAGQGKQLVDEALERLKKPEAIKNMIAVLVPILLLLMVLIWEPSAANILLAVFVGLFFFMILTQLRRNEQFLPKVLVDNSKNRHAPFVDATSAHAGALLGDVRHDPYQCFMGDTRIIIKDATSEKRVRIQDFVNDILEKSDNVITSSDKEYTAVFLDKPVYVVAMDTVTQLPVLARVLSVNRLHHHGKVVRIETMQGNILEVTPEHRILIRESDSLIMKEARELTVGDEVVLVKDNTDLVSLHDLTFDHDMSYDYLKRKGLLPLTREDPRLKGFAELLGFLFSFDSVRFTRKGLIVKSKRKEVLQGFNEKLAEVFSGLNYPYSLQYERNSSSSAWTYLLKDKVISNYLLILGSSTSNHDIPYRVIPLWVQASEHLKERFYQAVVSSSLDLSMINEQTLVKSCLRFKTSSKTIERDYELLLEIKVFLEEHLIAVTSIEESTDDNDKRLVMNLSSDIDSLFQLWNILQDFPLLDFTLLRNVLRQVKEEKQQEFEALMQGGLGAEAAMKSLGLSPRSLFYVLTEEVA